MKHITLRVAKDKDAAEILKIYAPYVQETVITFEYAVPDLEEFRNRIRSIGSDYPYLVCLIDGQIVGYAYAHRLLERAAYQWNAELSVYVDRAFVRLGIGRSLFASLLEILKLQNVQNVYGIVSSPNPNSERLHESFGFRCLGVHRNTGFKQGAWHDVSWYEKSIGDHGLNPLPVVPFREIGQHRVREILEKHCAMIKKASDG